MWTHSLIKLSSLCQTLTLPSLWQVVQAIDTFARSEAVEEEDQPLETTPTTVNKDISPRTENPEALGKTKSPEKRVASFTESSPAKDQPASMEATLAPYVTSPAPDMADFEALLDLDPADAMEKLLAGEFSYSSKTEQGSSEQTSFFTSSSTMNTEPQKFKDLVLEKDFLKNFPIDEDL